MQTLATARASAREAARRFRAERPARRAALRERRAALARIGAAARARLDEHPGVKEARFRRRRRLAILTALLLSLLALLSKCQCEAPLPPPVPAPAASPPVAAPKPAPPPPPVVQRPRRPTSAKVAALPRADFAVDGQKPPPWLEELRLQVAARSPRLAQCFVGAAVPGALRWTAAVNPGSGQVSDSTLEGNGAEVVLTQRQRACMNEVLGSPPFKLTPSEAGDALTRRVSLLVEF